jgi:hypothetical protein
MKKMIFSILILSFVQPIMSNVVYYNDFEDSSETLTEWSYNPQFQNTTPGTVQHASDRFIGQFSGNESTILSLYNLPSHNEIKVSFDLYIIRTWDGNAPPLPRAGPDIWDLSIVGEQTLLHTTFSNTGIEANQYQAYPDNFPGGNYPARTGAAESNTLGFTVVDYGGEIMDRRSSGDALYNNGNIARRRNRARLSGKSQIRPFSENTVESWSDF